MKTIILILLLFAVISNAADRAPNQDRQSNIDKLFIQSVQSQGEQRIAARFQLSKILLQLKMPQSAAFPLLQILKESNNKQVKAKALIQLIQIGRQLEDPTLTEFAIKRISPSELDQNTRYIYLLNLAENTQDPVKALTYVDSALAENSNSEEALYNKGLLLLKNKKPGEAYFYFEKMYQQFKSLPGMNRRKSMALLGMARSKYQAKQWNEAIDLYRRISKSDVFYRESLVELSWSLFRAGKFRSALSPLQSLQTPFYENFYQPESLLLHAIILLFSCQYEDAIANYQSFEKNYLPAMARLQAWGKVSHSNADMTKELELAKKSLKNQYITGQTSVENILPFFILRTVMTEADVAMELRFQERIRAEKEILDRSFKNKDSLIYAYCRRILSLRNQAAQTRLNKKVQHHLGEKMVEINDLQNQFDFVNYEALNGSRLALQKKIGASDVVTPSKVALKRDYYVQNGYRFWPAQGEYWRDEIGSYQFVGENACAKK
jgi:hypothetical protein